MCKQWQPAGENCVWGKRLMENARINLLLPYSLCPCPRTRGKPTTTTTTTTTKTMMMLVVACQRQLPPFSDLSRGLATTSHVTRATCHAVTYRPGDMSPALSYTVGRRRAVINRLVSRQHRWQLKTLRPCLMYNDDNNNHDRIKHYANKAAT